MGDSEESYRQLLAHVPDAIAFRYREGDDGLRYTHAAGEGFDRIGLTAGSLVGRRVAAGRPPAVRDAMRERYRRALDGETATLDVEAEGRHYHLHLFPITDESGDVVSGGGVARDVTERTVYERELERQTERLERVLRTASHDIRNPLTVARVHVDRLDAECDSEHVDPVGDALDRIESLVDRMLSSEYRAAEDATDLDLADVARAAWKNVSTENATLDVESSRRVHADEGDLRRLFENLFRNSVEHGSTSNRPEAGDSVEHGSTSNRPEAGDSVEHGSTSNRPEAGDSVGDAGPTPTVRVGVLDDGRGFYVADDGPGIPESERARVFEREHSGTPDGTGLGLFIVSRIAEAHGWTVDAAESVDGGARFEFRGVEAT